MRMDRATLLNSKSTISHCQPSLVKLKFDGTDTDTDTNFLANFRARILARKSSPFSLPRARHARQSSPTCPPTRPTRALILAGILARLSDRDARVHTCKRVQYYTVHDKLSCTRLQNYTIGASVSVSVSVPLNLSFTRQRASVDSKLLNRPRNVGYYHTFER